MPFPCPHPSPPDARARCSSAQLFVLDTALCPRRPRDFLFLSICVYNNAQKPPPDVCIQATFTLFQMSNKRATKRPRPLRRVRFETDSEADDGVDDDVYYSPNVFIDSDPSEVSDSVTFSDVSDSVTFPTWSRATGRPSPPHARKRCSSAQLFVLDIALCPRHSSLSSTRLFVLGVDDTFSFFPPVYITTRRIPSRRLHASHVHSVPDVQQTCNKTPASHAARPLRD